MNASEPNPGRSVCMVAYTNYGGDARVQREAETLVQEGFSVTCLIPSNGTEPAATTEIRGVTVRRLTIRKYTGKSLFRYGLSYLAFLFNSSFALARHWKSQGLDTVHIHNMPDFLIFSAMLPRLAGKKVILDVHDSMPETFATKFPISPALAFRLLSLEEKLCSYLAHRVICVNHPQRDALVARGIPAAKTFVSLNSPDHRVFAMRKPQIRTASDSFRLIYHGTMANRLGVDVLIRAVAALKGRIPGLELHLWGGGEDLRRFQDLAAELSLADTVHFRPRGVPLHDLPKRLLEMDLGVVGNRNTSATELMLPVKLLEYVTLGIPTVAPRLRTIRHYFSEDMLAFFEPDDSESMAEQILDMYRSPERREKLAGNAQQFVATWGWDKQGPELVALHSSL